MRVNVEHECRVCGEKGILDVEDSSWLAMVADVGVAHHCNEEMMWRYVK
jgi:hypothetical protein